MNSVDPAIAAGATLDGAELLPSHGGWLHVYIERRIVAVLRPPAKSTSGRYSLTTTLDASDRLPCLQGAVNAVNACRR